MATNIFAGKLNYLRTYDFPAGKTLYTWEELGFDATTIDVVYEGGGSAPKSWKPNELSALSGVKPNTGYRVVAKVDMEKAVFKPPTGGGSGDANLLYLH